MSNRPSTIPEGLQVELSGGKVRPGQSAEADPWMQMLDDRSDECVAILDRDHDAIGRRVKEPGWVEAEPQVLLLPEPIRQAVMAWALRPPEDSPSA